MTTNNSNNNQVFEYHTVVVTEVVVAPDGTVVEVRAPYMEDTLPPSTSTMVWDNDAEKWVRQSPADSDSQGIWHGGGWAVVGSALHALLAPQKVCTACGKQCGTDPKHKDMYGNPYHSDCWHESFYEDIKSEPVGTVLCCGQCVFAVGKTASGLMHGDPSCGGAYSEVRDSGLDDTPSCVSCNKPILGSVHIAGADPCCEVCWHEDCIEYGQDCEQCDYKVPRYCDDCGCEGTEPDFIVIGEGTYCKPCVADHRRG